MGYGVNQRRHVRLMSYFHDSLHAEADLIRRYGEKLRGAKVFLYRFNNAPGSPVANKPLCARPCLLCGHILRAMGVGRVDFVDDGENIQELRGRDLPMLREDPATLTRMFLARMGDRHHGKFMAQDHLAI